MNRRNFLLKSSLTGFSLSILTTSACTRESKKNIGLQREDQDGALFSLSEITVDQLQQKMQAGEYTSHAITLMYINRIKAIDDSGPSLNSVIELNPDALSIADAMDQERKQGNVRGPLHGVPILIKDNIDTSDKMMTTAGSLALEGNIAARDAFIVKKLREAGAVLLAKQI